MMLRKKREKKNKTRQDFSFPSREESTTLESVFADKNATIEADSAAKKEQKKAEDSIPQIFTPEQVTWCFDAYCGILSFAFSIILKSDFKKIHEELSFDEREKNAMAIPLAKIASKYAPVSWAGMTAEIELIGTLGIYSVTGFKRAQIVAEKEKENKKDLHGAPAVTPLRRNSVAEQA